MKWPPNKHPGEDVLEEYSFDRLAGDALEEFEDHLLLCAECRAALENADQYICLMKAATARYVAGEAAPIAAPRVRLGGRGLRWNAAAAAIILLTSLTALLSWRSPTGDPKTIALEAFRGGSIATVSQAPAGLPLNLQIDLKDVPPAAGYRVEVVDAAGRRVWFGGTPAHLAKGLPAGIYWVRLLTDTGDLLREFGLRAG